MGATYGCTGQGTFTHDMTLISCRDKSYSPTSGMALLSVLPRVMHVAIDNNAVASNAVLAIVTDAINADASATTVAVVTAVIVVAKVQRNRGRC